VSLIGTFIVLKAIGYSANTVSLLTVVLAIGIVVDDAIVVVENERVMEENPELSPGGDKVRDGGDHGADHRDYLGDCSRSSFPSPSFQAFPASCSGNSP
jgi:AcrB/AcrD/AcrF family